MAAILLFISFALCVWMLRSFKPGITGLWQVSGRSEIKNFDEVVKLDVAYIDGWTIWKDIEILLKTVKVVLMKDGAK
ncbi:galactosyl transferase CpsE [Streptococcus pneumoniae]|nr:galactosyl transferase CpsE [Streptococcus pneumoniae]